MNTEVQKATELQQTFAFEKESEIRVFNIDGLPWFVAADICHALRLKNPRVYVSVLEDCEKRKLNLRRENQSVGNPEFWIISESGLYFLMLRCRDAVKPGTVPYRFRLWVTQEVLPAIRRTGAYSMNQPYPFSQLPTRCIKLTCHTESGYSKQAYLLYGDDWWYGCSPMSGDIENRMQSFFKGIGVEDKDTVRCETQAFTIRNGICKPSPFAYLPYDKRPKALPNQNVLVNCEQAIEKYRKAKKAVITSATTMIEYLELNS